jgi:hypothetical protein
MKNSFVETLQTLAAGTVPSAWHELYPASMSRK